MNEKQLLKELLKKDKNLQKAIDRALGKGYPEGKTDNGNRWYPSQNEECDCCKTIRTPSRAYPWSLYKHCNSVKHIANRYGYDLKEFKSWVKLYKELTSNDSSVSEDAWNRR